MASTRFAMAMAGALLWVGASGVASAQSAEVRGEELYGLCSQCHGERGEGNREALAPAIAGLDAWYVEAALHNFQRGGRGMHPDDTAGMRMRPMSRTLHSDADIAAVAAYVASLPAAQPEPQLAGGDARRGQALFGPCIACHGVDGKGNQSVNGPPLVTASDWYLYSQLERFRSGVRGSNPKDSTGMLMRPMAMTLANDQAMLDVIAYIMTLRD